jgi:hypothetical protein
MQGQGARVQREHWGHGAHPSVGAGSSRGGQRSQFSNQHAYSSARREARGYGSVGRRRHFPLASVDAALGYSVFTGESKTSDWARKFHFLPGSGFPRRGSPVSPLARENKGGQKTKMGLTSPKLVSAKKFSA